MLIQHPKQQKISELFVQEKKELEKVESHYITKDHHSIELSLNLWHKEEISLPEMEQVESRSKVLNLRMKTSKLSILVEEICQWLMQDLIQMDLNSS